MHRKFSLILRIKRNHILLKLSELKGEPDESQLWRLRITPEGTFLITMFSNSHKMLYGAGGLSTLLIDYRPQEKDWCAVPQVNWRIEKRHENGAFYVVNGVGKVLAGDGNNVYLLELKNQDAYHMWELIYFNKPDELLLIGSGIYCLKHKKSGKLLSCESGGLPKFLALVKRPNSSQFWRLIKIQNDLSWGVKLLC